MPALALRAPARAKVQRLPLPFPLLPMRRPAPRRSRRARRRPLRICNPSIHAVAALGSGAIEDLLNERPLLACRLFRALAMHLTRQMIDMRETKMPAVLDGILSQGQGGAKEGASLVADGGAGGVAVADAPTSSANHSAAEGGEAPAEGAAGAPRAKGGRHRTASVALQDLDKSEHRNLMPPSGASQKHGALLYSNARVHVVSLEDGSPALLHGAPMDAATISLYELALTIDEPGVGAAIAAIGSVHTAAPCVRTAAPCARAGLR